MLFYEKLVSASFFLVTFAYKITRLHCFIYGELVALH